MDKFALIGYPIAHSLSPKLFRAAYGGKYQYDLVEESDFEKAWKAFEDYELSAKTLTAPDQELLKTMFADRSQALDAALHLGYARKEPDGSIKVMREGAEFAQKIKPIGLTPPW